MADRRGARQGDGLTDLCRLVLRKDSGERLEDSRRQLSKTLGHILVESVPKLQQFLAVSAYSESSERAQRDRLGTEVGLGDMS